VNNDFKVKSSNKTKAMEFSFNGMTYTVNSWKDILLKLLTILAKAHHDFERILEIKGKYRFVFFCRSLDIKETKKDKRN
jgi:hypothetical protein